MKKNITYLAIAIFSIFSFEQLKKIKLDEWIKKGGLVFNSPCMSSDFYHFINCDEVELCTMVSIAMTSAYDN